MLKKLFLLILVICLFSTNNFAFANQRIKILVNNSEISSDVEPFINNGTTYVPLRFISEALNTDSILWNEETQSVTIKKDNNTLNFFINKNYAFINNTRKSLSGTPLIKQSRTFVPLRIISENLNATVNWNATTKVISISTKKKPSSGSNNSTVTPSTSSKPSISISTNNNDAIYWLARIIEAEASGEPYAGKVAVGEVILNRVSSNEFPNTIWGVIFDNNFGIQFEPVANGTIYNVPSQDSINAAKEALNGSNYVLGSLYFLNPDIASSNWITKNREFCTTIANHDFYF